MSEMAKFSWEPLDFLDALGVIPEEEEYGASFHYVVVRAPIRLELTVWPLNADVAVSLYCLPQVEPVLNLTLLDCPGARLVNDKRGKFIEFAAGANMFAGRYDFTAPAPYGFRLWVEPYVQVEPFAYQT